MPVEIKTSTQTFSVLGVPIARLTMKTALDAVHAFVEEGIAGRFVTFTNVHLIVEAKRSPALMKMLQASDLNCPDGRPVSWLGKSRFPGEVDHVPGPDFMPEFCRESVKLGYSHFIYGGAPGIALEAARTLEEQCPGIVIAGFHSPPFRSLSAEEDEACCRMINESKAQIVWVCLGCPKQERWIYEHRSRLNATVLLAVGQAVDILAGSRNRAPGLMQRGGLEWVYRLLKDPRRLWKRYLITNTLFVGWLLQERWRTVRSK